MTSSRLPSWWRSIGVHSRRAMPALQVVAIVPLALSIGAAQQERGARELPVLEAGDWRIVNDGVMGGRSQSTVRSTTDGTLIFEGTVSLENNGGFASARTMLAADLSPYAGLQLRVRGDGRRYQVRLRMDQRFDGVAYTVSFATDGEWQIIRLPFDDFQPTFRGFRPRRAEPLDAARVRQFGLLIADKQEGQFQLEIASVGVYATDPDPKP